MRKQMSKLFHINDGYFKLPDGFNHNIGCALVLFGTYLQRQGIELEDANKQYDEINALSDFLENDELRCLLSCSISESE